MAKFGGQTSTFKIDLTDGGALTDISSHIVKVSGLPGAQGLIDTTTFGSSGRKFFPDELEAADVSIDMIWDNTVSTGPDAIFGVMRTQSETRSFEYSPDGGTTKYTGECWLESYEITSAVGDVVKATARLKIDGPVTRT